MQSYPSSIHLVKVSISLSKNDLEFIDRKVEDGMYESRSAAVAAGIRRLRVREMASEYAAAIEEDMTNDDDWSEYAYAPNDGVA